MRVLAGDHPVGGRGRVLAGQVEVAGDVVAGAGRDDARGGVGAGDRLDARGGPCRRRRRRPAPRPRRRPPARARSSASSASRPARSRTSKPGVAEPRQRRVARAAPRPCRTSGWSSRAISRGPRREPSRRVRRPGAARTAKWSGRGADGLGEPGEGVEDPVGVEAGAGDGEGQPRVVARRSSTWPCRQAWWAGCRVAVVGDRRRVGLVDRQQVAGAGHGRRPPARWPAAHEVARAQARRSDVPGHLALARATRAGRRGRPLHGRGVASQRRRLVGESSSYAALACAGAGGRGARDDLGDQEEDDHRDRQERIVNGSVDGVATAAKTKRADDDPGPVRAQRACPARRRRG